MRNLIRIAIQLFLIISIENVYYDYYMEYRYYTGNIYSGMILPAVIVIIALVGVYWFCHHFGIFDLSYGASVISSCISLVLWILVLFFSLEKNQDEFLGQPFILFLTSLISLGGIIILSIVYNIIIKMK